MAYWHSVCPVCEQGRLFVTKLLGTGELFVLCEECESAWKAPEQIDPETHYDFRGEPTAKATRDDIEAAGWFRYQLNEVKRPAV